MLGGGLAKVGVIAVDETKLHANASNRSNTDIRSGPDLSIAELSPWGGPTVWSRCRLGGRTERSRALARVGPVSDGPVADRGDANRLVAVGEPVNDAIRADPQRAKTP